VRLSRAPNVFPTATPSSARVAGDASLRLRQQKRSSGSSKAPTGGFSLAESGNASTRPRAALPSTRRHCSRRSRQVHGRERTIHHPTTWGRRVAPFSAGSRSDCQSRVLKKGLRVGAGLKPAPTKHKQPVSTPPNGTTIATETRIASVFSSPSANQSLTNAANRAMILAI